MKHITIFASGNGTNAENITRFFATGYLARVDVVLCNNATAKVVERMRPYKVPVRIFSKEDWERGTEIIKDLKSLRTDLVVLAGFTGYVVKKIIDAYPGRIINIHPALLPKHGGKGMYGDHVHQAVLDAGENESGVTIHYVTEEVDGGSIIRQEKCPVMPDDTVETLAKRVHALEYKIYPRVIQQVLMRLPDLPDYDYSNQSY
jgi:phosphoribosylglycinamide formyltransferase-1